MGGTTTAPSIADLLCYQQTACRVPRPSVQTMHGSGSPGNLYFFALPRSVVTALTKPGGSGSDPVSCLIVLPLIFGHTKVLSLPSSFIQMTNIPSLLLQNPWPAGGSELAANFGVAQALSTVKLSSPASKAFMSYSSVFVFSDDYLYFISDLIPDCVLFIHPP